ncbi:N-acetyltransferase [Candidatus Sumerlaeota bacterium]|nr:N-acetyltransferase [Candidatus Sumerlaeota bacterium]
MANAHIRKAGLADVPAIHGLIQEASKTVPVIPRSQFEIYSMLRDFFVFDEGRGCQACCALHITWHDLAEVKSLVVDESLRGRGIGRDLVQACLDEARTLQVSQVFALTNVTDFFLKMGFSRTEKENLPQKIWGECVRCPKFPNCDETAVILDTGATLDTDIPLPRLT